MVQQDVQTLVSLSGHSKSLSESKKSLSTMLCNFDRFRSFEGIRAGIGR
jgi:hypothetical protein